MRDAILNYIAIKREKTAVFLRSAAVGAMLFRGVPMAAVASGWELSASVGVRTGELLALIIFLLGSSAAAVAHELPEKAVHRALDITAALIYAYCSAGADGSVMRKVIDCMLICSTLLADGRGKRGAVLSAFIAFTAAVVSCVGVVLPSDGAFVPLAAALLSGTAVSQISDDSAKSSAGFIAGAAAVMTLDLLG